MHAVGLMPIGRHPIPDSPLDEAHRGLLLELGRSEMLDRRNARFREIDDRDLHRLCRRGTRAGIVPPAAPAKEHAHEPDYPLTFRGPDSAVNTPRPTRQPPERYRPSANARPVRPSIGAMLPAASA